MDAAVTGFEGLVLPRSEVSGAGTDVRSSSMDSFPTTPSPSAPFTGVSFCIACRLYYRTDKPHDCMGAASQDDALITALRIKKRQLEIEVEVLKLHRQIETLKGELEALKGGTVNTCPTAEYLASGGR